MLWTDIPVRLQQQITTRESADFPGSVQDMTHV